MPSRPYDAVPYPTYPRLETHPDRLAAVATLAGLQPAPVTRCRVLEIGCGDGGNLIPMAYFLPESAFLGVDLAGHAIAQGRELVRELRLKNIALRESDFQHVDAGEFDYIVAHGLYSWLPPEHQDRLLALCAERLAPRGVAYISYNTWPGRHERHMLREVLLYHLREVRAPRRRLREARRLLRVIGTPAARAMAAEPDDLLFHDDLAPFNTPVWFRDFESHAARHRLQYLGDAGLGQFRREDEQFDDFVRMRGFRQSLLCRPGLELQRPSAGLMPRFLFSSASVSPLSDAYPLPVPYDELRDYRLTEEDLFELYQLGAVRLHVWDFPCEEAPGDRPRATRLARAQARRSNLVTGIAHHLVELDDSDRELILRCDGRRRITSPRVEWFARMGLLEV